MLCIAIALGIGQTAYADSLTIDFEAYNLGTIDGQQGWSGGGLASTDPIDTSVDQAVTNAASHVGSQSWRISNNGSHNGAFGGWPFGPPLASTAGQPSSGAPSQQLFATFYFRAGSAVADGSNIEVDLGTSTGDDRNSFFAITNRADADGGLQLRAAEPVENNLGGCDNFYPTQIIATNLDRTTWHRIDFKAEFIDNDYNDTIEYFLDGAPLINPRTNGTTWLTFEGYRNQCNYPYALSNRIYFRSGADPSAYGSFTNGAAAGIVFDDLTYETAPACGPRYVAPTGSDIVDRSCLDSSNPCATIQHAVDQACAGDTINVAAGTYRENVVVTKGVELSGAGQGSSIVEPAISNPNCNTGGGGSLCGGAASNIVLVQASNVKIHDFTLDGDNPSLTSGIVVNGADLDARNGVITNYVAGDFQNLEVSNLTVQNIYLRGIYGSYNSSGTFNFHDNTVDNVAADYASIAIFSYLGGGTVARNTVSNANDAISANHSHGIQFLDNVVTDSASGVHTDNSGDSGGTGDLIQGNTVSNCAPDGFGIWTFVPYTTPTVQNNTVTNCAVGLAAAGRGATGPGSTTFTGNTVDGSHLAGSVGAYVTTSEFGYGVGNVNASFTGNLLTNNDQGFLVQDKVCSTNSTTGCQVDSDCPAYPSETCLTGSTATVNATCNRIADNTDGILTEALGSPSLVVFNSNSIDGNTTGADASAVPAGSINAQANWWGCVAGPGNPGCDTVTAGVDYSSFATSVPACVSCNANSDCSDGLTCNGNETCNLGTHMCQAGTPPNCSALTNECATGICVEPTGCVADPLPNGTLCLSGAGVCQTGVCTSAYSLTLNYARLRCDSSTRRNNGVASVTGLVNDNDTGGGLEGDLTQGRVSVQIDSGSFHVTVPLSGCSANSYGSVRCKDPANKTRALFRAWRVKGPLLYRMSLRQSGLSDAVTGITQPTGPVTVTLHQSSVDRPDVIGDVDTCTPAGQYALLCREP